MSTYDDANRILGRQFPSRAVANDIVGRTFPALSAGDRVLAGAGLIPRGGRGGLKAGTAGGLRGPVPPGTRGGPLYRGPRTPLGELIAKDAAKVAREGGTVDIQVWAGLLQQAGVAEATIFEAYEAAGGSADLAAEQQRGDTSDFLGDFVQALEARGVDAAVIAGSYQQAGGRL